MCVKYRNIQHIYIYFPKSTSIIEEHVKIIKQVSESMVNDTV